MIESFTEQLQRDLAAERPARRRDDQALHMQQTQALVEQVRALSADQQAVLRDHWRLRLCDPGLEPNPLMRAAIGRALALLDWDARPGIGVTADGVPEVTWVTIPAGEFLFEKGERRHLPAFAISQYHITYQQFQAFIDAPDGWHDPRWWEGFPESDRELANVRKGPPQQAFQYVNHPYDGASWYDMVAFCRWWSHRLGGPWEANRVAEWPVRLPTAEEWEKAARGTDGRIYPWGNEFHTGYANFDEIDRMGIELASSLKKDGRVGDYFYGGTTAVGIFPQGASPYGVLDMVGNAWDVILSLVRGGDAMDLSHTDPRCICGGTWFVTQSYCKATARTMHSRHIRFYDYGFRVVMKP